MQYHLCIHVRNVGECPTPSTRRMYVPTAQKKHPLCNGLDTNHVALSCILSVMRYIDKISGANKILGLG